MEWNTVIVTDSNQRRYLVATVATTESKMQNMGCCARNAGKAMELAPFPLRPASRPISAISPSHSRPGLTF